MRRTILIAILFALLSVGAATNAQTERVIWFWAWRPYDMRIEVLEDQLGDLIAFTPDGTVNVLMQDVFPMVLDRIDDTRAFVAARSGDTYSMVYLTPTAAHHVQDLFDQAYMDENRSMTQSIESMLPELLPVGDDAFLLGHTELSGAVLYNAAEDTTIFPELRQWCERDCVRVSEDGRFIRYRVLERREAILGIPWQLYEYDTETGTERLVYEQAEVESSSGDQNSRCTPDRYGDRWLCALYNSGYPTFPVEQIIIHMDGTIEPVDTNWLLKVFDQRWYFFDLTGIPNNCTDCTVPVYPDGDQSAAFAFYIPPGEDLPWGPYSDIYSSRMLSESHLLVGISEYYALSRTGDITVLGHRHCCTDPVSMDFFDPETGWMVTFNLAARQTQLWNTRELELIGSFEPEIMPGIGSTFHDYSVALTTEGVAVTAVYSLFDDTLYNGILGRPRGFIDAFPGGLVWSNYDWDYDDGTGYVTLVGDIIRWTPEAGDTVIVEDAMPVLRWR